MNTIAGTSWIQLRSLRAPWHWLPSDDSWRTACGIGPLGLPSSIPMVSTSPYEKLGDDADLCRPCAVAAGRAALEGLAL